MHSGYVILATITAICFAFYTGLQYVSETQPGYSIVIDFDSFYEGAINRGNSVINHSSSPPELNENIESENKDYNIESLESSSINEWNSEDYESNETNIQPDNTYHASNEISTRVENLEKLCEGKQKGIMSTNFRTNLVSWYGISSGNVAFWTCFQPKAASTSMAAAMLLATGFIPEYQRNNISNPMLREGKMGQSPKSLQKFKTMPQKYRYMGENLDKNDSFESLIVAREPMSRLVSAWKDKIARKGGRQFYYERYTIKMLQKMGKTDCPRNHIQAYDTEGCRVSFENFIRWIVGGNSAADEHWTPGSDLCLACSARYTFIAHSEHFNEDIMVAAKKLKIDPATLPDSYYNVNGHATSINSESEALESTKEMFKDIPKDILKKLLNIYRKDYNAFSYPIPDWLENA